VLKRRDGLGMFVTEDMSLPIKKILKRSYGPLPVTSLRAKESKPVQHH
jgi:hypothetical protein